MRVPAGIIVGNKDVRADQNDMFLKSLLNIADDLSSNIYVKMFGEKPALNTFLFHACLEKSSDYKHNLLYPQERLTVQDFRNFIHFFLDQGYIFTGPFTAGVDQLDPAKKYGLITFDDGYYNNINLLPVLEEFNIPALFFVPTDYLYNGKIFWSDALYFYRKQSGQTDETILKEVMHLKGLRLSEIESYIRTNFGKHALDVQHDANRFMTEQEFVQFARHPLVHIGNHTHTHEVLTNLSEEEVNKEFRTAQDILQKLLGRQPDWVSYPNGSFNERIIAIAAEAGMHTGISTIMEKNYFPLAHYIHGQLLLHRFNPLVQDGKMALNKFRSSFQLKTKLKQWIN